MKFFIRKIINTKLAIMFRNLFKIRPVYFNHFKNLNNSSISDSFCWRTDNGFTTKFKFSDILNLFLQLKNSWVEIDFFDKNNNFLKKIKVNDLKLSNEIIIDKKFLNGKEDYGSFYIYHFIDNFKNYANETLINRCYTGFSKENKFFSFVHGNTISKYKKNDDRENELTNLVSTSYLKNHYYKIQKKFNEDENSELVFINPTDKKIDFSIDDKNYLLEGGCSQKIRFTNKKTVTIKTNCLWLRPLVFSYKKDFFDVHHS